MRWYLSEDEYELYYVYDDEFEDKFDVFAETIAFIIQDMDGSTNGRNLVRAYLLSIHIQVFEKLMTEPSHYIPKWRLLV